MVQSESSLVFKATLDNIEFEQGMRRMRGDLRIMQTEADKTGSSFERIGGVTRTIASGLAAIGTAGVGALTGLATSSPAVAGEMARINNSMRELGFAAGDILKPAFSAVADDILPSLVSSLEDGGGTINSFLSNLTNGLKELTSANNQVQQAQNSLEQGTGTQGKVDAAKRGRLGTFLGGGVGAAGFGSLAALAGFGPYGIAAAGIIGGLGGANAVNTPYDQQTASPMTPQVGIPGGPGIAFPAFGQWLENFIDKFTDKDISLYTPQGYGGGGSI